MTSDRSIFNPSKTGIIWFSLMPGRHPFMTDHMSPSGASISLSSICNPVFYFNSKLNFSFHVNHIVSTCFYSLRQLISICCLLPRSMVSKLDIAIVPNWKPFQPTLETPVSHKQPAPHFPTFLLWSTQRFHPRSSAMAVYCSLDWVQWVLVSMEMFERRCSGLSSNYTSLDNKWAQEYTIFIIQSYFGDFTNAHKMRWTIICICCSITLDFPSTSQAMGNFQYWP